MNQVNISQESPVKRDATKQLDQVKELANEDRTELSIINAKNQNPVELS